MSSPAIVSRNKSKVYYIGFKIYYALFFFHSLFPEHNGTRKKLSTHSFSRISGLETGALSISFVWQKLPSSPAMLAPLPDMRPSIKPLLRSSVSRLHATVRAWSMALILLLQLSSLNLLCVIPNLALIYDTKFQQCTELVRGDWCGAQPGGGGYTPTISVASDARRRKFWLHINWIQWILFSSTISQVIWQ